MTKAVVYLAVAMLSVACVSTRVPIAERAPLIAAEDAYTLGFSPFWVSDLAIQSDQRISSVALLGDMIVTIESPDNLASAVSVNNGAILWRRVLAPASTQLVDPVRSGDKIYVTADTQLYVLDANNGKMLETQDLDSAVSAGPALVNDTAVFGNANGKVFGHDVVRGYATWGYQLNAQVRARPIVVGTSVIVTDVSGMYAAFTSTGDLLWRGRTHGPIVVPAEGSAQTVFIPSEDYSLYALFRTSGTDRWIYRTAEPLRASPEVIDNFVFQPLLVSRALVALDAGRGEEVWRIDELAKPVTKIDNKILLNFGDRLRLVDARNGQQVAQVPVEPLRAVLLADNSIILVTARGRMTRLDPLR